jgi:hypothetical protein
VRPLSSLRLAVAPPTGEPGQDTPVTATPRLDPVVSGRLPVLPERWPETTGLTSYLSDCLSFTGQRFVESPAFRKVSRTLPKPWPFPIRHSLCQAFRPLWNGGDDLNSAARAIRIVLVRSSSHAPSGQLRFTQGRNPPGLFHSARDGFFASLTAQLLVRDTGDARTSPEEPVNPAWFRRPCGLRPQGPDQPARSDLSPVTWDYLRVLGVRPENGTFAVRLRPILKSRFKYVLLPIAQNKSTVHKI